MDKNKCSSCGAAPQGCSCKNKDFTKAVIEIDNPGCITLMRKVTIPASMGDDAAVPPAIGKYHNVLLNYEANNRTYLYSSDGIPVQLNNGYSDYEAAINLPQINGVTLRGNKTSEDLGLQNALTAGDGINIDANSNTISVTDIEQYAHFFDTVSDMKSASVDVGNYVKTLGFHTLNDGGGGLYKIIDGTGITPDDAFYVALDNGLVAQLIVNDLVNVKSLGAIGDNSTDNSEIFRKAVDSGLDIFIPIGTFLVDNITLKTKQKLIGENLTKSIIKSIPNNDQTCIIRVGDNDGVYSVLENFSIDGYKSHNPSEIDAIYLNNSSSDSHHYIKMVRVFSCSGNGIRAANQREMRIENCVISGCNKNGILFESSSDNSIISTTVSGCLLNGYRFSTAMNRITNCKAFSNGRVTDRANDTPYTQRYAGFYDTRGGNTYVDCDSQGNYGHGFWFVDTNSLAAYGLRSNLNGIQVNDDNTIVSFTETPYYDGVHFDHCRYATIDTSALSMYTDDRKCQRYAVYISDEHGDPDYLTITANSVHQLNGTVNTNSLPAGLAHYTIISNGRLFNS